MTDLADLDLNRKKPKVHKLRVARLFLIYLILNFPRVKGYLLEGGLWGGPAVKHHNLFEFLVVEKIGEGPNTTHNAQTLRQLVEQATVGLITI